MCLACVAGLACIPGADCRISFADTPLTTGGQTAHGNSFTACATGTITSIEIEYVGDAVTDRVLTIFEGNTVSGSPAYTQTGVALGGGGGLKSMVLSTPFPVVSGAVYTFNVDVGSPVKCRLYVPGSTSYLSNGALANGSIGYRVAIASETTPPTRTAAVNPDSLWPPIGRSVPVTLSGKITDLGSGVNAATARY
jgi:hypothetical protein